ncbi:tRNA pseudouridine synthase A [Bifidobacterium margollesii]|uniref:tRNA pseudouridine synthase A n=1 Tax=Bifidobacterium margollesii TaxID=2020964 RepID=A0A2N5JD38_9BIFI|nr:tRNA pseudouridine synthase A [Bifidobacterium margollesii]PLS32099.1 tRNA pseudouridine synthase A [Bifidobacterium margollesii]
MRLRIDLGYDGTGFYGWARQPQLRTVQGEVESALRKILHLTGEPGRQDGEPREQEIRLTVAGRTDTGVHALHQVCHIDIEPEILERCVGHMQASPTEALYRRLRRVVPDDIAIHAVSVAPEGFDARFSALERTYVYRVSDAGQPVDPRTRGFVVAIDDPLDIEAMNEAAAHTIGLHDFGSFATPNPGGTTIRNVKLARWTRVPTLPLTGVETEQQAGETQAGETPVGKTQAGKTQSGETMTDSMGEGTSEIADGASASGRYVTSHVESGLVCFTIVADAFARNMVRSLVNGCLQVGRGRKTVEWFAGKIAEPVREGSTGPAAAKGLTLEHVQYPADDQLAERAQAIRAKRTL